MLLGRKMTFILPWFGISVDLGAFPNAPPNNISFRNPDYLSTRCSLAIKRETLKSISFTRCAFLQWFLCPVSAPHLTIARPRYKSLVQSTSYHTEIMNQQHLSLKILVYNSQLYCSWAVGSQQKAMIPPPQEPCNSQECQHKPRSSLDLCLSCLPFGVNLLTNLERNHHLHGATGATFCSGMQGPNFRPKRLELSRPEKQEAKFVPQKISIKQSRYVIGHRS